MILYSTKKESPPVDLKTAVLTGLPPDNGLYLPESWPKIDAEELFKKDIPSFAALSFIILKEILKDDIPQNEIKKICDDAFNFEVPLYDLRDNLKVLELFHGPTLAFKDFGARFMARLMSYFIKNENRKIHILVATSGDTGSAIAQGFLGIDNIKVTILFPKGKVSPIQQKQLTTNGKNIYAIEVEGTFDDCQAIVKAAFLDKKLSEKYGLASANSINIARLIPQSLYYWWAVYQIRKKTNKPITFCTPSGNYGNLCGGVIAQKMGLEIDKFIAASNLNDVVPKFINTGVFEPKPSIQTISNAMDVGNPSNFPRLQSLISDNSTIMRKQIDGLSVDEKTTKKTLEQTYKEAGYLMCPHTSVGLHAMEKWATHNFEKETVNIVLATAHPVKFGSVINEIFEISIEIPERLKKIIDKEENFITIPPTIDALKDYLVKV